MKFISPLLVAAAFAVPFIALAQMNITDADGNPANVMTAQGKMITLKLVVGEPLKILVVGREEAKIDLKNLVLTVRRMNPTKQKTLATERNENTFVVSEALNADAVTDLEVTTKLQGKKESFRFKLPVKKP
ncbi:MAG: hypothetical protein H7326_11665 [Bdellovibrionaceae bacterium]|nr:hypothetical protein [Pseudobdellovibrionaceae bacterium]